MIKGLQITGIWVDELYNMNEFLKRDPRAIELIQDTKLTIQRTIQKIMDNDPLMDNELIAFLKEEGIVSGGISASAMNRERIFDCDLFLKSKEALDKFNQLMTMRNRTKTLVKDIDPKYSTHTLVSGKCVTTRATTFYNNLQVITMGTAEQLLKDFDFIHCKPYLDLKTNTYYISPKQYESISKKHLVRNMESSQMIDEDRIQKFKDRGWTY